jgi:DNA modification methylase
MDQFVAENYAIYCGDCCEVLPKLPAESIGLSVFSPPFSSLYTYSDDNRDMGNARSHDEFFDHFGFLVDELERLMIPGRVVAVHCMDLPTYKRNGEDIGLYDFSGDVIRLFISKGFVFHSRHCIWKDPLFAATRTKAIGLAHKQIVKDSSACRMGIPDYLLAFRKKGENPDPVANPNGLTSYHGKRTIPNLPTDVVQGKNRRSQWIWQKYASPVWDDIRQTKVLNFRAARDSDDEKHICPLQLDVIERCVQLWSKESDTVLTPFMGVGSEIYVAVKNGRKGIGVELKRSYFKQAQKNIELASRQDEESFQLL